MPQFLWLKFNHACLLLISMLWHRQGIFKSKGDKLSSSAGCRIWTRVFGTESAADWMPADKPTELSRIKLKNLNSAVHPYDQRAFSPLDPTAIWLSHPTLAIYMFVVVNFDALAQFSNRKETNCLPLLNAGFGPGSLEPNLLTECPLTNRLSYRGSS